MTPHTKEHRRRIAAACANRGKYWTRERLLEWGKAQPRKPTLTDVAPRHMAVYREFGSLRKFQAALGYTPNPPGHPPGPKAAKGGKR